MINQACPGWAELVEAGVTSGPVAEAAVARYLDPVLGAGADTLVLGCTHYSFLRHLISARAGAQVAVVDPARAVARRVAAVAGETIASDGSGRLELLASGDPADAREVMREVTGIDRAVTAVSLGEE